MKKYVCRMCGTVYEDDETDLRKSVRVCSKACYRKYKNIQNREYYYRQAAKKEAERAEEEAKKPVRIEPKNTMAEINEMARAEGLTYGQMQGKLFCLEHPLIHRRGRR